MVYPAELSARSYPRIIVVHGSEPEGIEFANRLARHLATPRAGIRPSEVFLMHRIQATQAVAERTFPQSAVIVDLDFQITHTGLIYETRDGCYTTGCAGRPAMPPPSSFLGRCDSIRAPAASSSTATRSS